MLGTPFLGLRPFCEMLYFPSDCRAGTAHPLPVNPTSHCDVLQWALLVTPKGV